MTAETLTAFHPVCDEVARLVADIKAHLPCLERSAASATTPKVRAAVWAEVHMFRTVLTLLGADLPADGVGPLPERNGTVPNTPERSGTETNNEH